MATTSNSDVGHFDRWARSYDRSVMQGLFFMPIHSQVLALLSRNGLNAPPACIVDVGCGTGRLLRTASALWPKAELLGIDPAARMVAEASRLNPKATFKLAPAESLPLADRSADVIMSSMSFHHWSDQGKGIREISRVLRPGGLFCLADHSFTAFNLIGERARSRAQVRELMAAAGLSVLVQKFAPLPFILITLARK